MKKLLIATTMIAVAVAPLAYSDTVYFTGGDGASAVTAGNWSGGVLPVPGTDAGIVGSTADGTNTTITSRFSAVDITFKGTSVVSRTAKLAVQFNNNAVITFEDDSSFNAAGSDGNADNFVVGKVGTATLNWDSTGSILNAGNASLGDAGATEHGYINQSAGSLAFPIISMKLDSIYTISGGALSVANTIDFRGDGVGDYETASPGNNYLNFLTNGTTGTVTLATASLAEVQAFIDDDRLRVDGDLNTDGDYSAFSLTSDGGTGTIITVIPEPATLGMVAAFGGAILFIRRKLMM